MLRRTLADAKVQVALLAGENDELRHQLSVLRKRFMPTAIVAATDDGFWSTLVAIVTFSFWSRRKQASNGYRELLTGGANHGTLPSDVAGGSARVGTEDPPAAAAEQADEADVAAPAARSEARRALAGHKTFANFSPERLDAVIEGLVEIRCHRGDILIRQGDAEDTRFYVVASGAYSVLVQAKGDTPVHTYRAVGDSFGELALRYGSPRKATVRCDEGGVLWALDRSQYQQLGGAGGGGGAPTATPID